MRLKMSKQTRQELLEITRLEYIQASWKEKRVLLDALVRATGFNRKYLTKMLGEKSIKVVGTRQRKRCYDIEVQEALIRIWLASNRIASKRLIPFLPIMLEKLEKHGHLSLPKEVKIKLLKLSPATADRLLKEEKKKHGRSKSTTRPGRLLKHNIPLRTYDDWNETEPGFLEADLVAHCGEVTSGEYLNTLTMTDMASGWTELRSVIGKSESQVLSAICRTATKLPFPAKGLDTDNGKEFINFATIEWCDQQRLTFTRAREYKKNDQAHVEEKNGSIVRRLVGYDRFEGEEACKKMNALYTVARLYINYFQPSMKLLSKSREGGKVSKKYDTARTPCERLLQSNLPSEIKQKLRTIFEKLDPLLLLEQMEKLQVELWATAVCPDPAKVSNDSLAAVFARASSDLDEIIIQARQFRNGLRVKSQAKLSESTSQTQNGNLSQREAMRRFIFGLPQGQMFRMEDLRNLGSESSANQLVRDLVRLKALQKVGRGRYSTPQIRKSAN